MPFGSLKKSQGGMKSKVFPVKITTMDAELEFKIEVTLNESFFVNTRCSAQIGLIGET